MLIASCRSSHFETKNHHPVWTLVMRLVGPGSLQMSLNQRSGQLELALFKWGYGDITYIVKGDYKPTYNWGFLAADLVDTQHGLSSCLDIHID